MVQKQAKPLEVEARLWKGIESQETNYDRSSSAWSLRIITVSIS